MYIAVHQGMERLETCHLGRQGNVIGQSFWARGYYVSTAGRDEETIRQYISKQEEIYRKIDQLELFK